MWNNFLSQFFPTPTHFFSIFISRNGFFCCLRISYAAFRIAQENDRFFCLPVDVLVPMNTFLFLGVFFFFIPVEHFSLVTWKDDVLGRRNMEKCRKTPSHGYKTLGGERKKVEKEKFRCMKCIRTKSMEKNVRATLASGELWIPSNRIGSLCLALFPFKFHCSCFYALFWCCCNCWKRILFSISCISFVIVTITRLYFIQAIFILSCSMLFFFYFFLCLFHSIYALFSNECRQIYMDTYKESESYRIGVR